MRLLRLAGILLLAGCTGAPAAIAPVGMKPVTAEQVGDWVRQTTPRAPTAIQYRAVVTDQGKGHGTISILPPDSIRLDFSGALGMGRTAAAVVGDSALWAEPKESVEKIVPSYPLLWAMVGVARPPAAGDALLGLQQGDLTAWQYAGPGDTVTYVRTPRELRTEVRRAGKLFGQVTASFDANGVLTRSRLLVLSPQTRLDITFGKVAVVKGFARGIWDAPVD